MNNIWFTGVPGSKWSGIDIQLRQVVNADRSDESPSRTQYHRPVHPNDTNNGHRGSYWGPGMGSGEDWIDFNYFKPHKLQDDIDSVFHSTGYRVIKSHFFARHFNLDYIWNHFPGDYMVLIYRESQKSFAWWSEVMDFSEGHYPDYRPGYKDYNTMRQLIWEENANIVDFALRKNVQFELYDCTSSFSSIKGFDKNVAKYMQQHFSDVYVAVAQIPQS